MLEKLKEWCEQNQFKYEVGKEWCDCVDYTDFMNVYLKDKYYLTLYYHTNDVYSCTLYQSKSHIATISNITDITDITNILEAYDII